MKVFHTIEELRTYIKEEKKQNKTIGLVPTMGYLHDGHKSLIEKARQMCDIAVVSIFVNPIQFGANEDLDKYPRDLEKDKITCENAGCNVIFNPDVKEMYQDPLTYVYVDDLSKKLCGITRPIHFRGVATVVSKLFNIITPDYAFFGQKDAQQLIIIKKMVQDLNFDIKIIACPIIREEDGLAKSSRNVYLNAQERKDAVLLYKSLVHAQSRINQGETDPQKIKKEMEDIIVSSPLAKIDYIELVDTKALQPLSELKGEILIALAVKFGSTRLIDNIMLSI